MADLIIKPLLGQGNTVTIQDQAGGAILTSENSGATIGGGVTIPAAGITGVLPVGVTGGSGLDAKLLQIVTGVGGNNSGVTHNGAGHTTLETLSPTISVKKGNKVCCWVTGIAWHVEGTNGHNGNIYILLSDGTNTGRTNTQLMQNQSNFHYNRSYGTSHYGEMTTASGSGNVTVTAKITGHTEAQATIYFGDTNTDCELGFCLMEVQV